MATSAVTASLVINFQTPEYSGDGFLSLEVDSRPEEDGGLNGGNTSFAPGDTAYILMFKESSVTLSDIFTTGGALTKVSDSEIQSFTDLDAEIITVSNSATANLSRPANMDDITLSWVGKTKKIGKGTQKLEMLVDVTGNTSEVVIDVGTEMVGVIKAEYSSKASAYKLSSVPKEYPAVVIFANGTIG